MMLKDAMAIMGLPDDIALISGAQNVEDIDRVEAPSDEVFVAQPDGELRRGRRRPQADLPRATHARHRRGDAFRDAVELIEVVAIDIGGDRRGVARKGLFDAFGQERLQREIEAGKALQRLSDVGVGLAQFGAGEARPQIDFDFAVVRSPGVVGGFRAADALRNRRGPPALRRAPR